LHDRGDNYLDARRLSGGLYHVTSRGDRREDIYLNDEDRIAWLDILGAVCKCSNWACLA
jgi:putative transposase